MFSVSPAKTPSSMKWKELTPNTAPSAQALYPLRLPANLEHNWRHTSAVRLIAAGVDVAVIRSWLGHASLDTTNRYAQANLETKRKAIEQLDGGARPAKPPRWKRDRDLLSWLDSL
jgi:integrase